MAEPTKLLILEDTVVRSMAENPNFLREFPFLSGAANPPAKKGCNCGQRGVQRVNQVNGVKQALVSMGNERKQRLKQMLNATQVRVRVSQGNKIVEYTF